MAVDCAVIRVFTAESYSVRRTALLFESQCAGRHPDFVRSFLFMFNCHRQISNAIITVAIAAGSGMAFGASTLQPKDCADHWLTPGEKSSMSWKLTADAADAPVKSLDYTIFNYDEKTVQQGKADVAEDGSVTVTVALPSGFYTIEYPATKQRFGIMSIESFSGKTDPFFCIDAALGCLVQKNSVAPARESLIRVLKRSGVAMARERLGWDELNPAADKWNWEGSWDYDTLRKQYTRIGVPVLEMFHITPQYIGKAIGGGPYRLPLDMIATDNAWRQIGARWNTHWAGLEVWNEPNGWFGGGAPTDQYVPIAKTMAFTAEKAGFTVPLVGGIDPWGWDPVFFEMCSRNGLLENIDAWSCHTYGHNNAMAIQGLMQNYRDAFTKAGKASMPLWDTESGFAWNVGGPRPSAQQDTASALEIIMKAIEGNANGMARYFPFVYPFYEESVSNYSMTDRVGTPLRSIGSYAVAIRLLAHHDYVGDWKHSDATIKLARVFSTGDDTVVVLFTGSVTADAAVKIPLPQEPVEIFGIDGRPLTRTADGKIPVSDGLTYLRMKKPDMAMINTDTATAKLFRISRQPLPKRTPASPIIVQFRPDLLADAYEPDPRGYRILEKAPETLPLSVQLTNLDEKPHRVTVTLAGKNGSLGGSETREVPARDKVIVEWPVKIDNSVRTNPGNFDMTITASSDTVSRIDPVLIRMRGEPTVASWLQRFASKQRLSITDLKRWSRSTLNETTLTMSLSDEDTWKLDLKFNNAPDRWAYPRYELPANVNMGRFKGMVFEGRCRESAMAVRAVVWEREPAGQEKIFMSHNVLKSDNQWHAVYVPFTTKEIGVESIDPSGAIRPEKVRVLSFGMNSGAQDNTLEIRNLWLVGD